MDGTAVLLELVALISFFSPFYFCSSSFPSFPLNLEERFRPKPLVCPLLGLRFDVSDTHSILRSPLLNRLSAKCGGGAQIQSKATVTHGTVREQQMPAQNLGADR